MRLANARMKAGMSEAALERLANLPAGCVAAIEAGTRALGPTDHAMAARIAGALTIEVHLLDELRDARADARGRAGRGE